MTTFSARLQQLVDGDRQQTAFARKCDVPVSTIRDYLKGAVPSLDRVLQIARATGVSILWLATGEGPVDSSELLTHRSSAPLSNESPSNISPPNGFVLPKPFRASTSGDVENLGETAIIGFREMWLNSLGILPEYAQFLVHQGDNMASTIHNGDLLLVDRHFGRVISDAVYVMVLAGSVVVKRLQPLSDGSVMLINDNPHYQSERVDKTSVKDLQIEGRVKWYGRAI